MLCFRRCTRWRKRPRRRLQKRPTLRAGLECPVATWHRECVATAPERSEPITDGTSNSIWFFGSFLCVTKSLMVVLNVVRMFTLHFINLAPMRTPAVSPICPRKWRRANSETSSRRLDAFRYSVESGATLICVGGVIVVCSSLYTYSFASSVSTLLATRTRTSPRDSPSSPTSCVRTPRERSKCSTATSSTTWSSVSSGPGS